MKTDTAMHPESERTEFLTVTDVAAWLNLPKGTVARLLRTQQLAGVYFGTRAGWRVRVEDVETYLAHTTQRHQPGQQTGAEARSTSTNFTHVTHKKPQHDE